MGGAATSAFSERPLVWTLSHHATTTPLLLKALEDCVEGLRFMVHTSDLPGSLCEDDDVEMCFIMRTSSMHPVMDRLLLVDEAKSISEWGDEGDKGGKGGGAWREEKKASSKKKTKKGKDKCRSGGGEWKSGDVDMNDDDDDDEYDDDDDDEYDDEDEDGYAAESKSEDKCDRRVGDKHGSRSRSASPCFRAQSSALLGIDVNLVVSMASYAGADEGGAVGTAANMASLSFPADVTEYVRPFEERMRSFYVNSEIDTTRWRHHITSGGASNVATTLGGGDPVATGGGGSSSNKYIEQPSSGMDLDNESVGSIGSAGSSVNGKATLDYESLYAAYCDADIKIVDLGNACWTHKHFTDDVQTRQYRCPEVILGQSYHTQADIWSLACIIFEMLTGDLMFDPHAGKSWDRDEDHLAMMIELLGAFPRKMISTGKFTGEFFSRKGELRHIHHLKFWSLKDVLRDKYHFAEADAVEVADFLAPMLMLDPSCRASAADALMHPFLEETVETPASHRESK
jgi:hypothetical protein